MANNRQLVRCTGTAHLIKRMWAKAEAEREQEQIEQFQIPLHVEVEPTPKKRRRKQKEIVMVERNGVFVPENGEW